MEGSHPCYGATTLPVVFVILGDVEVDAPALVCGECVAGGADEADVAESREGMAEDGVVEGLCEAVSDELA